MLKKIITQDKFLKNNLVFLVGSVAVSALNYLYNPILGHLLSLEAFGELQAVLSLSIQLGIITNVIGMIVVNIAASKEEGERLVVIRALQTIGIIVNVGLVLILLLSSKFLSLGLGFHSQTPFLFLALFLLITTPLIIRNSHLQAHHNFVGVSLTNAISSGFKILASAVLVLLGFGTTGAIGGLVIAQLVAYGYVFSKTRDDMAFNKEFISLSFLKSRYEKAVVSKELRYGSFIFIMLLCAIFLYTSDTLIVKIFTNPTETGLYAGTAAIARIIFFLTSSVSGVLIATVNTTTSEKTNRSTLLKALAIISAVTIPGILAFTVAPKFIVSILMGAKFLPFAQRLKYIATISAIAALNNLLFSYFIAIRRYRIAAIAIVGLFVTFLLVSVNHATITAIINDYVVGNALTFVLLLAATFPLGSFRKSEIT